MGQTSKDVVWKRDKVELWRYRSDRRRWRPAVFIVHSLISRSYVLDLSPDNTFVGRLLEAGLDVFLIDLGAPDQRDADNSLETYVDDYVPQPVRALLAEAGSDGLTVLGYCLCGWSHGRCAGLGLTGRRYGTIRGKSARAGCGAVREGALVEISCAFPTTLDSPQHVALAEQLGYGRAWLYDTPQQSPDVWMTLALAAERTERIGLGPGVLVPTLRHPMVNAAATAALAALAPGRVAVAFGTGFTGRRAMGYGAIPWSYMDAYIRAYRGLLRGETVEWEGARMRMLHPSGHAAARPVEVPVIVAALGPKGRAVARELGDGLFATSLVPQFAKEFSRVCYLFWGTVLADGEDLQSGRVRAAGGPGLALAYHGAYELDMPLSELPGGAEWQTVIDRTPPVERHLAVHAQHCVGLNEADEAAWDAGGYVMLKQATLSGTADELRARLSGLADVGVTELVYQPCGPDIRRELEVFMTTAKADAAA